MILYIVTDTHEAYRTRPAWLSHRNTFEELAGDACVVLHHSRIDLATVERIAPWAVCHSGGSSDYRDTAAGYRDVVLRYASAQIGLCSGHQLIARIFGGKLGAMRKLAPGEPDPAPTYHPGYFKEYGVYSVRKVKDDPLFQGMGRQMRVFENHYWEVKRLPPSLVLLASAPVCRVQAFRHRARPVYGVQFNPEADGVGSHDGEAILRNFFKIARAHRGAIGGGMGTERKTG